MPKDFLQRFRDLLEETSKISKSDMAAVQEIMQRKLHRQLFRSEGSCLNCKNLTTYGKPSRPHVQRGDEWLDSLFWRWKTPPTVEVKSHKSKMVLVINGFMATTVMPYLCKACVHTLMLQKESAIERYKNRAQETHRDKWQEDADKVRGKRQATAAGRFWALHNIITQADVESLKEMPYDKFLQSTYWEIVRNYVLYKSNYECNLCHRRDRLQVHHRTYEHRGSEYLYVKTDLIALCATCHARHHDKLSEVES